MVDGVDDKGGAPTGDAAGKTVETGDDKGAAAAKTLMGAAVDDAGAGTGTDDSTGKTADDKSADDKAGTEGKEGADGGAGDKKGDDKKPVDRIPAEGKYELSLPENSALDPTVIDRLSAFARENNLSNDDAKAALAFLNTEVGEREALYFESIKPGGAKWTENVEAWKAAALKDPDIGGSVDKVNQNALYAKKAVEQFFGADSKAVLDFLEETGMGANPVIIKGLAKIHKLTKEGSLSRDFQPPAPEKKSAAERLYPKHPSEGQGAK